MKRYFFGILLLAAAAAVAPPSARAQMEKTTIAFPATAFIFSPLYIAQDAGIFKSEGLDVKEEVIQGIGSANAVISGAVDFSSSSGVTLTRAVARKRPVIGIADTYNRVGFSVIVRKSIAEKDHFNPKAPLAERGKILKGLRIAVGGIYAIPDGYLRTIANIAGLNPEKDMVITGITPREQLGAFQRNAIDAVSSGPPVTNEILHDGLGVVVANGNTGKVLDPPWLTHVAANVVMTRRQFCADHRSICMKMGHAIAKACAYMHEHPKESMAILGKRLNVKNPEVLASAYQETLEAIPTPPILSAADLKAADEMNVAAGFMKKSAMLKSYDSIFTNEYVK